MKLIYIEWTDAIANGAEWVDMATAREWGKRTQWLVEEVGWVVEENKKYIILASTHKPEDEFCDEQVKLLQKIPKTWIKKRVDLTRTII